MRYRTVICVLLALVPLIAGCGLFSDGQGLSSTPGPAPTEPVPVKDVAGEVSETSAPKSAGTSAPTRAPAMSRDLTEWEVSTLKERILKADVVVRARLASKAVSNRSIYEPSAGRIDYFPYVEFTFTVLETLKGTAASTIIVELVVSPPIYDVPSTATDAEQKATDWKDDWYDSQWDDRDAILFLADIDNTAEAHTFSGRSSDVEYVFVGHRSLAATSVNAYDDWSIRGKYNKTWLPANSTTAGAETFYLESPDEEEDPDTVTLSSLKSSITSVLAEVRDSVPGYRECLIAKEVEERVVRPAGYWYDNQVEIESGLPAGTVLAVLGASGSRIYHRHHL